MKTFHTVPAATFSCVLLGMLITAGPAGAADWEFIPDIDVAASRIENPRLEPDENDDSSNRVVADARVRVQNRGERGFFVMEPRVRADLYRADEDSDLDGEDLFFNAQARYRWEAASVGFRLKANEQSYLRSEIVDAIPDDPDETDVVEVDTGNLQEFSAKRRRITATPFVDFNLTERSSLQLRGTFTDVTYSGPPIDNRSDFQNGEVSIGISRRVDDLTSVTARVFADAFEADLTGNETDSVGVEGQFIRPLSETWSLTLAAGVQRTEYSFLQNDVRITNADATPTYGLGLRKRSEQTLWNIDFRRLVSPNGNGYVVVRDEGRIFADWDLTQRLTGRVGMVFYSTDTVGDVQGGESRRDVRFQSRLEWAWTPRFLINGGINYTFREFKNQGTDADSNEIYVGVTYRGLARSGRR